jgi:hypothetical protein
MQNLRKCKVTYEKNEEFYFHKWTEDGRTKFHGEDPQKDSTYVVTKAIVENIITGVVEYADADCIIFLD